MGSHSGEHASTPRPGHPARKASLIAEDAAMSDGCWTTTWPGIWSSSRGIERQDKVGSKGLLIFESQRVIRSDGL